MSMPEPAERIITFSQAVNEALAEEMRSEKTTHQTGYPEWLTRAHASQPRIPHRLDHKGIGVKDPKPSTVISLPFHQTKCHWALIKNNFYIPSRRVTSPFPRK